MKRKSSKPNRQQQRCIGLVVGLLLLLAWLGRWKWPAPSQVQLYLESMRTNTQYRHQELYLQPDYLNPTFDWENSRLLAQTPLDSRAHGSVLLITRPGHRRRVTDLIGGLPLGPRQSRLVLQYNTTTFDAKGRVTNERDFELDPVRVRVPQQSTPPGCESVPCLECQFDSTCDSELTLWTMENVLPKPKHQARSILATTGLKSDVSLLYFSYHDFGLLKPATTEIKPRLAASFISNCESVKRLRLVRDLQAILGDGEVSGFGRCFSSKAAAATGDKLHLLGTQYKFSLAFENSERVDYVTEKLYGPLAVGSVPVYLGAHNVKFFAPDTTPYPYESQAMISTRDFSDDAAVIAQVLTHLANTPELYAQLLAWKRRGLSDDFKALASLSNTHSSCRACVYAADELRRTRGVNAYDLREVVPVNAQFGHGLFVRERGAYSFVRLGFASPPHSILYVLEMVLANVQQAPVNLWKDNGEKGDVPPRVYALYTLHSKRPVLSDEDLQALPNHAELEVVFI
ncbi:hypothetical protein BASA81_002220 [Batrachochytrium salamandrivorans]|nr:hypothetical protein BASA81_002220 [Batrachochytrium salamandrivorans]